jgi:CDP-glucose 4,6-dehydratase
MVVIAQAGLPAAEFWRGKRVVVTGHTGFKGGWLVLWLQRMGALVTGISLAPATSPSLFELAGIEQLCQSNICDIRDAQQLASIITSANPEVIFHLAAQPLVRASYKSPIETFETNVMGTVHTMDAMRDLADLRVAVMVTTDKVYRNNEWHWPYRETDSLGGHDPYSASKAASEIVIDSYRSAFFADNHLAISSARAGNVIGGGDWSDDRLIPDAVRAWQRDVVLSIRRPNAIRPWQHVLEPVAGYLKLAEKTWVAPSIAGAFNFGPPTSEAATVKNVVDLAINIYGSGAAHFGDGSEGPHEAGWLALETSKTSSLLDVSTRWDLAEAVTRTLDWYRDLKAGGKAAELCHRDIDDFSGLK